MTEGENLGKFHCTYCQYTTSKKANWDRHIKTKKHNDKEAAAKGEAEASKVCDSEERLYECKCGKTYKYHTGLSRHKKACSYLNENDKINTENLPMNVVINIYMPCENNIPTCM